MLKDSVEKFVASFSGISGKYDYSNISNKVEIPQIELMNRINNEFQKPFLKNLYNNPEWKQRVFWVVAGTLQNEYDDMDLDVSLDRITNKIKEYIEVKKGV